jgi:H+/Cl- antiporter ClcA
MNENRPNIVTVGVLAGAAANLIVWLWNTLRPTMPLGPNEALALGTLMTGAVQFLDRWEKRQGGYVVAKYADQRPGQPP